LREEESGGSGGKGSSSTATAPASSSSSSRYRRPNKIEDIRYDYYTRYINKEGYDDGKYRVENPVNDETGLWYTPQNLDLVPALLQHGYDATLKAPMSEQPLLLIERSYNPPPLRQHLLELMFEECDVPALFLGKDAAMSCYGCGRVTATVVDIGYSGTTVTPVYDGYVEQKGIRRSPIGVKQMDKSILSILDKLNAGGKPVMPSYQVWNSPKNNKQTKRRSAPFHEAARLQLALECRESGGAGAEIDTNPGFHAPSKQFELPDGTVLNIQSQHRFSVADWVFSGQEKLNEREEVVGKYKERLTDVVDAAMALYDEEEDGNVEDGAKASKNDDDEFSEAAAVGISKSKKAKRGRGGSVKQQSSKKTAASAPSQVAPFDYRAIHKACGPYLKTHLETRITSSPVSSMICDAAYRCDRDQQVALLGNVVVGGGGSCIGPTEQAVPDLIREQVEAIIHAHTPGWRVKVLTPGFQERSILSWLGGSILASMGTFHDMWITKSEYDEWGSSIVNRKCP